jgi:hypothetical protein
VLLTAFLAVPVFWASFVTRQILSWRRATGEHRAQLKWLMAGSVATVIGLAGTFLLQSFTGLLGALDNAMLGLGIFSLPVCITFAISKYHLYDIDRIISRTLAYAIVTGVLVGLYAALVLLATRLLTFQTPVAVAASTLVAAALFNPLRHRVQLRVDWRGSSKTTKPAGGCSWQPRSSTTEERTFPAGWRDPSGGYWWSAPGSRV